MCISVTQCRYGQGARFGGVDVEELKRIRGKHDIWLLSRLLCLQDVEELKWCC